VRVPLTANATAQCIAATAAAAALTTSVDMATKSQCGAAQNLAEALFPPDEISLDV